jgi:transposase
MPRERLSMRKIKEMLRLKYECGLSIRKIAASLNLSVGSVHDYLTRLEVAGVSWPQAQELTEQQLQERLFGGEVIVSSRGTKLPDWKHIDTELKRKGVTLRLLWEEYRTDCPQGLGYSQFCKRFADFQQTLDPRMRQSHTAGEKLFVDYAGMTLPLTDRHTGEIMSVQIFVATQGASSYTFAEASLTQTIPDWIASHVRAFAFFGGVTQLLVCDNLKSGVTTPCRYQPDIQRTYEEMAAHYGCAVLPARIVKPRDKAKVEAAVQSVEERLLAPLRNRQFFCLQDINQALRPLLSLLNHQKMQGKEESRAQLFTLLDQPALNPLPVRPYELGLWSRARVNLDYHIAFEDRFYSVPYTFLKQEVEVRATSALLEIFQGGQRIASHVRGGQKYGASTQPEHMPQAHKRQAEWSSERILAWVEKSGSAMKEVAEAILKSRPHPEQGFRACLGLLRLSETYGTQRAEAACKKALALCAPNYKSVKAILQNGMDRLPDKPAEAPSLPVEHDNIRGSHYYTGHPSEPNQA